MSFVRNLVGQFRFQECVSSCTYFLAAATWLVAIAIPNVASAATYKATLLHPAGFDVSEARGVSNGSQVGNGRSSGGAGVTHALLWYGTATGVVDLHPTGFLRTEARGVS